MLWLQWAWEGFQSGVVKMLGLWWLVPVFIGLQLLRDSGWLTLVSDQMRPLLTPLRLPSDAGLPVVAGLAVGVTFGSGVIMQAGEEGRLTRNQLTTACIFIGICHAVIEETILFAAIGASSLLLLAIRFITALCFGTVASRLLLPIGNITPGNTRAVRG